MSKVNCEYLKVGKGACPRSEVTVLVAAFICLAVVVLVSDVASAQRPRRRAPARSRPITRPAGTDYSKFSHATQKHQGACNTCHEVPTGNWKKARGFPDVADYPGHDACVSCHRPQFFKGAKPPLCSVCHTKVSPRDDVRFAFRNPNSQHQFLIEFPHDKHQDVIAQLKTPVMQSVSLRVWAHARSAVFQTSQAKSLRYNNCEICHVPRATAPTVPLSGWPDSFVPDAASFKSVPSDHASCFNCHWKAQQPSSENCAGCHKLTKPFSPNDAPERLSMKFRHARDQHVAECTTCHINITKSATLRGLKPDVPITSCTECHNKDGLRQDVSKELEALDRNRDFACSYCHTSDVGRRDAPASHYLIAGRPLLLRKDMK